MDISSIGAASIQISLSQTQQSVDVAMTKKIMDNYEDSATAIIEDIKQVMASTNILDIVV